MESPRWPTFGEILQYLRDRGFRVVPGKPGYVVAEDPAEDCWFVFRDRDAATPGRETELTNLRTQLTYRGYVTDEDFARFWDPVRQSHPARPTPQ